MRLRISLAVAALVAAIGVLAIGVGTAAAGNEGPQGQPDPQTTNVPYVAWNGEQVKVVKCFGNQDNVSEAAFNQGGGIASYLSGKFRVELWSGDQAQQPVFLNDNDGSVVGQWDNGRLCFAVHVASLEPGLAVIKLAVSPNLLGLFPGLDVLAKHQFLVIWMTDQAPVITEVAGANLGDPTGNGIFNPIPGPNGNYFANGLINVKVKGTFPLGGAFTALGHPTVTLPDDWNWLATHMAVDDSLTGSNFPGAAAMRWDIHDDDLTTEGHVASSFCTDKPAATEAVDNCLGTLYGDADLGPFSNIYGGSTDAMGPFDPIRGDQTLLSDGNLNADDAPMPQLRVDVSLSADSTVGTLLKADKSLIYSRDGSGSGDAHNLYAPFYKALLPPALPGDDPNTSGVAGSFSNNFTGFLGWVDATKTYSTEDVAGIYDYWDTFTTSYSHGYNDCYDVLGNPIPLPHGKTGVAVYTDEHGEAYVQYVPDSGIVLTPDSNGRCDIYGPAPIGHSSISAVSVYPDQPVIWDGGNKTSNALAKTVNFASSKTLNCIPKSTNEAFCVETILDLEGNPVEGAKVQFSAQAFQGSAPVIGSDAAKVGAYDTRGQTDWGTVSLTFVNVRTGANGEAGIFVRSTTGSCIDVVSENVGTRNGGDGIFRSTDFNPTTGAACGTTTPPTGGGTTPTGAGGSSSNSGSASSGTATAPVVTAAPVAVSTPIPTAKTIPTSATKTMTLASARVVKIKQGRYLMVRVNGVAKTAKLRITLIGKSHGKVTRHVITRIVATNHQVRVGNLRLAPSVRSVRVALA